MNDDALLSVDIFKRVVRPVSGRIKTTILLRVLLRLSRGRNYISKFKFILLFDSDEFFRPF